MKKLLRPLGLFLIVTLVVMQFFQSEKNNNVSATAVASDINRIYPLPADVQEVLQKSCYDCHSNNTDYPWYDNVQPVSWWLHRHIAEGKKELNFNEFASYRIGKQFEKLEEITEQIKDDEMPLSSYTLIHTDAKLSPEKKTLVIQWAGNLRDSIRATYPADSLVKKK